MEWPRSSGVLLHITSLPSRFGIGDLGPSARSFADWLAEGRQQIWQMLPLNPTGYGDSPYQALSAFAGNTLLISLDDLVRDGLLDASDLQGLPEFPDRIVDYEAVKRYKLPLLRKAFANFSGPLGMQRSEHEQWILQFVAFASLKRSNAEKPWWEWPAEIRSCNFETVRKIIDSDPTLSANFQFEIFCQFLFFRQWLALRGYCHQRGIKLMGDLPIYVAHDSADVWSHPDLFCLREDGSATSVAGVPPDYFSATGQLWGNPIYDWPRHRDTNFAWWIERVRHTLAMFDYIRIDHFRGFEAYWEVPGGDETAQNGKWTKAPGLELFTTLQAGLGDLPVLAENLGVITPEVEALRMRFHLPGMAILQFAFGSDPQAPYFSPHNYTHDRIAYTGTHDNDTVMGWWNRRESTATESAEDIRRQHERATRYLHICDEEVNWAFIRALMASVAKGAIFPMQDILGLGTEARMNYPGTRSGNWRWRMTDDQLSQHDAARLRELALLYQRAS